MLAVHWQVPDRPPEPCCYWLQQLAGSAVFILALPCRDPNLHFVEEVALAPPQVQIDMAQQQQNEAELNAAMAQPLPDEDEDLAE